MKKIYMILKRVIFLGESYSPHPALKKIKKKNNHYIIHIQNAPHDSEKKTHRKTWKLIKIRNKSVIIICPLNYNSFNPQNQFPGLIHLPVRSVLKAGASSVHPDSKAYFNQWDWLVKIQTIAKICSRGKL